MSKITYTFDTPVPSDFRKNGWFKSDNCLKFVTWAFARCLSFEHEICHDNQKIILKPFQFIFGRYKCSLETNMSEDEVRTQVKSMENAGFLKKSPNKTPNRFTIFEWTTEAFTQINPQVNPQETPKSSPTHPHKQEEQILDPKENNDECGSRCLYDCLEKDNRLDDDDKQALMKFPEERVIAAIQYSLTVKAKKSLMALLVWHCTTKKPPKVFNNQELKENKTLAKKLEGIKHAYTFEAAKESLLIIKGVTGKQEEIFYKESHEHFCKEIERIAKIKTKDYE